MVKFILSFFSLEFYVFTPEDMSCPSDPLGLVLKGLE